MKHYFQHIFYTKEEGFSLELMEEICRDAYSKCYKWWVDEIDCNTSWARQEINMPIEDIINLIYEESIHFTIIHRRGFKKENEKQYGNKWHIEIGFSALGPKNIFLWTNLEEDYLPYFIVKYNLKKLK